SSATLATAATLTLSGTPSINGTFQLNQGGWATGGTWSYGSGGTLAFNNSSGSYGVNTDVFWPATGGPVNVTVSGAGGVTMNVARAVSGVFQTAAGVTNANNLTLNGTAQINAGGYFTGSPTYGSSSTLVYNTGGTTYGRGAEWSATSGAGYPANVTINSGSSLDLGNGGTGTARQISGNLTLDGALYMDYGSNDMTQALTVLGNVTINTTGALSLSDAPGGDLIIKGNWTRNGSGVLTPKSRAVFFQGGNAQTLTGVTAFDYLNMGKSGNDLTLNNDITVNKTLKFSDNTSGGNSNGGSIITGSNSVTIASTGSNTGGSATSHVSGKLVQVYSTAGTKTFMIGKGGNYRPLTLNYSSLDNPSTVSAEQTESTLPGSLPGNTTATLARYWTVSQTGGTTYNYKITLDGTDFSASGTAVMLKGDGASNSAYAVTAPNYTNTTGFTSFSNFGLGDMSAPAAYNVTGTGSFCQGSGGLAVGLDNSQTGVTYELWKDDIATGETMPGTGASLNFGNKTEGTYTIKGTNAAGTITMNSSAVVTIIPAGLWTGAALDNDWTTADNWNWCGGIPTGSTNVIIPSGSTVHVTSSPGSYAECNNLTIGSTAILVIDAGKALKVNGTITNNNGASGLVIESDATGTGSLINGTASVDGTVKRYYTGSAWHLISTPVSGIQPDIFVTHYLQNFTESTNVYTDIILTIGGLNVFQGYALWNTNTTPQVTSYTGPLNTGSYTSAVTNFNEGWNLVGNPYPTAIDWLAVSGWTKTNVNNAIYLHKDNTTWATFVGGVGANGGTQYIASGQGFFVRASDAGSLAIDNGVKVFQNPTFFKETIPNLIRLQASGNGATDEAVVRFTPESTAGFDGDWDAVKMFAADDAVPQIYIKGNAVYTISSVPSAESVNVGFLCGTNGEYTIAATEINNFEEINLEDTKTGTFTKLNDAAYSFTYSTNDDPDRFILHLTPMSVPEQNKSGVHVYSQGRSVYVSLPSGNGEVTVYNLIGQVVASSTLTPKLNRMELRSQGVYIVNVKAAGTTYSTKVVIR
ncbi:MAG: T9SS type A sorting domain-containing protein, partial [Bacteroidales bacterium]